MQTIQFGNTEVSLEAVSRLQELIGPLHLKPDEGDALYFACKRDTYTRAELVQIAELLVVASPDECSEEGGYLRLWWD